MSAVDEAKKLAAIKIDDGVRYMDESGAVKTGVVVGFSDRLYHNRPVKMVLLSGRRSVPLADVLSRERYQGCGKGRVVFGEQEQQSA